MCKQNVHILLCVLLSCSFCVWGVSDAQGQQNSSAYQQVMEKLEQLQPGTSIEVKMGTEKEAYNVGELFEARFKTNQDCYGVLMYIAAAEKEDEKSVRYGDITFLFPNSWMPENLIQGGRVYSTTRDLNLPIEVVLPYGYETLNFFCSTEPFNLFKTDFTAEPLYTITPDDEQRLRQLADRLNLLDNYEWAGGSVTYLVRSGKPETRGLGDAIKVGALPPIGSTGTTGANAELFPPIGSTGTTGFSK